MKWSWLLLMAFPLTLLADVLRLPERKTNALDVEAIVARVRSLSLVEREAIVVREITEGNVPDWWRKFTEVTVSQEIDGKLQTLIYQVSPDVICVGDRNDFLRVPLSPPAAQQLAEVMDCLLPTPQMSDQIYAAASVKLAPQPFPPSAEMTQFAKFIEHHAVIEKQRAERSHRPGDLMAGHKKEVVISAQSFDATGKVGIYGWQKSEGKPIQPLYLGHTEYWVDYSHGVRLIKRDMVLNGQPIRAEHILADKKRCKLLSNEGPLRHPRYDTDRTTVLKLEPGVRVVFKEPLALDAAVPITLVIYATPNGGTAEQTIGRPPMEGDDWHYRIQNVGAQTKWLRRHAGLKNLVVAYVESAQKSWPHWCKQHDANHEIIPRLVQQISNHYAGRNVRITLSGHSGGGSFVCGYLHGVNVIPDQIERITFLDSNYHWDSAYHAPKLITWLKASADHRLSVLAYEDHVALLNGKTFISAQGGTWGRSQQMIEALQPAFELERSEQGDLLTVVSKQQQIQFLLRKNPEKKVYHTVLVQRNGFIETLLSGTPSAGKGYDFLGDPVYESIP
jgi:hypothetical protein